MATVTQFPNKSLIEEQASNWIVKFEGDTEPTAMDIQELNTWIKQSPMHRKVLLETAHNWNSMDIMAGLVIPLGQVDKPQSGHYESWSIAPLLAIAAALRWLAILLKSFSRPMIGLPALGLVAVTSLSLWVLVEPSNVPDSLYVTKVGQQSTHLLNDGSVLWLNSNSKVEVLFTANKRLFNLIEGEAHFKVQPDPDRPFEVYAGNRMVKAIGTAFSVYRLDGQIEVIVTEGKVDLAMVESTLVIATDDPQQFPLISLQERANSNATAPKVLTSLEAGQSVLIPVSSASLETPVEYNAPGDLARKLSWLEGKLVFAGESLEEVVQEVSRHTPIVIEVTDPDLKKLRIGGQFQAGETDALFDVLESGFGIKINKLSASHVQLDAK